jgi:hypothetical protein
MGNGIKGKEAALRSLIAGQEQKIAKAQKRIDELNKQIMDLLSAPSVPAPMPIDISMYCGKIMYASKKQANSARKLINRDLVKVGKKPMKRSYFCDQCSAWHLTSTPHWCPHPENENVNV